MSQRQLLAEVWGPGYADATGNLRLYMTQLRRKLEPDPARPRWLRTEPGMGYRYQPDGDEHPDGASLPASGESRPPGEPARRVLAKRPDARNRNGRPGRR
jgi:DNA-binding winged helix-turn-helix (wHTH) protein